MTATPRREDLDARRDQALDLLVDFLDQRQKHLRDRADVAGHVDEGIAVPRHVVACADLDEAGKRVAS